MQTLEFNGSLRHIYALAAALGKGFTTAKSMSAIFVGLWLLLKEV